METKFILGSVRREAENLGARGELTRAVRLSGAVNGDRGEGYFLLYPDFLVLLYRKLGERDYAGVLDDRGVWEFEDYQEAQYQLSVVLRHGDEVYRCVFAPSEREDAEAVMLAVREARDDREPDCSEAMLIFAALVRSLSGDGHMEYAARLLGGRLLAAGRRYAERFSLPQLAAQAAERLTPKQKQSLMLNLIELRMSDGEWTTAEQQGLGELAAALGWTEEQFREAGEFLLTKNSFPVLFG